MPALSPRFLPISVLLFALGVTTGCGSTAAPTTPEPASVTQVFSGTLGVNGSGFYSFTTTQTGTISLQLAKVQRDGLDVPDQITIGLGSPRGTDCSTSTSTTVAASSDLLLSASQSAGVYCVRVWDDGILPSAVTFSVNINRPIQ